MEAYSPTMATAVQHQVQQASLGRLRELLAYYRQRGGPGLGLAEQEATARATRHHLNYPPQAA